MINSVLVTNHLSNSLLLELRAPAASGLLIQDITGLGPVKATINMTDMSTIDGSSFNSSRLTNRNIVFTVVLLEKPDIETSRQLTYRYFPIGKQIRLDFTLDNRTCYVYGYVESNEPVIFSPQSTTQISIVCPDSYFYSTGDDGTTVTIFSGVVDVFEFPFSNESTSSKLLVMSTVSMDSAKNIAYTGDADIGLDIFIRAIGAATNITIYNVGTSDSMRIDTVKLATLTGDGILNSDEITISTIKGQKSITLLRAGVTYNILNCLDKDVDWLQITKGDNVLSFYADTGIENLQFRVENRTIYEGV